MSLKPTFQGEIQMRRWSDSSTQGVQITFGLPDSSDLEPLKAKAGKRFMAVLVEIGDDEQPVQEPEKVKVGPLCSEAVSLCKTRDFWVWLAEVHGVAEVAEELSEEGAKRWVLRICGVKSRKDLDADRQAGQDFVNLVRIPFMKWQQQRRKAA